MKSFLSSLRKLDSSTHALCDRKVFHRQHQLFTTLLLSGAIIGSSIGLMASPATAAPARKDWCSAIWSVDNAGTVSNGTTLVNPTTGATTTTSPAAGITMPPFFPGTGSVAGLGIHTRSGTLYAFDRGNIASAPSVVPVVLAKPGQLYKYKLGTDTNWVPVSVTGLIGLKDTQTISGASNNLNKITADDNNLYIAESNGIAVYKIPLNSSGSITGTSASVQTYSYVNDPPGTPPHRSFATGDIANVTVVMNGGDLTTDEYGDTYNITYNNTAANNNGGGAITTKKAYFYKQSGTTWIYQGETDATANFAGAAFYRGELFVKSATQLKKVPLVRSGSEYTGWSGTLGNVGLPSAGYSSGDLAACGTPNIQMTKTQQIYADAALTTLVADQTKARTGQYIKYTITAQNTGTSWSRNTTVTDSLPTGTTYVPNSASLNGTNSGFTTYPTSGFVINAPGSGVGIVPYTTGVAGSDTATISFAVQVTALSGTVQNQATIAYIDNAGLPSEPFVCTSPLLNCSITPSVAVTSVDFGDAPDGSAGTAAANYRTTESDNGPNHVITAALKLGATAPDTDDGLQQNTAANADGADEDAFTSLPNAPSTGTYSLNNVPVTNTTGSTATLRAWIDFNKNGSFEAGESASATVANNATTANLTWTVPAGTVTGSTYARFRLTTQALTDNTATTTEDERSFGAASNGEVEDYAVTLGPRPTASALPLTCPVNTSVSIASLDAGATNDATTITYPNAGGGGRTMVVTKLSGSNTISGPSPNMYPLGTGTPVGGIWLGSDDRVVRSWVGRDTETYEVTFDGDITALKMAFSAINGNTDGIEHIKILKVYDAAGNDITSTTNYGFVDNTPAGFGSLSFFTDTRTLEPTTYSPNLTEGGTYGNANGTIALQNAAGIRRVEFQRLEPGNLSSTNTTGKERSNGVGLGPIEYCNTPALVDYGDAPDGNTGVGTGNYKTTAIDNGPSHTIVNGLKLGTNIDADSGTLQDSTATADNTSGTPNDEDAFTTLPNVSTSGTYSLSNIPVTNSVGAATLHAWVDFNKNGSFEAGEYTSTPVANGATSANLSWTVPSGTTAGSTFARFRLTTQTLTDDTVTTAEDERSIGTAINGEVEDYAVSIAAKANLLLVKRITSIKDGATNTVTPYTAFVDNTSATTTAINDNHCNWPGATGTAGACTNTYTLGAIAPGKVKPGDEIEYTIYYLNAGNNKATARICDRIDPNLNFSLQGGNGIGLSKGGAAMSMLTNTGTDADNAQLTTPALATNCNLPNNSGTDVVVVDVGTADAPGIPGTPLMGSTGAGTPTTSYGYIRIKTTVK
jgi:uncharacterized repeat protein (TIGR01451 family)